VGRTPRRLADSHRRRIDGSDTSALSERDSGNGARTTDTSDKESMNYDDTTSEQHSDSSTGITSFTEPTVTTSARLGDYLRVHHVKVLLPVVLPLPVALITGLLGWFWVAGAAVATAAVAGGVMLRLHLTTPAHMNIRERLSRWIATAQLNQSLPWQYDDVRDGAPHGVRRFGYTAHGAGVAERADGRVVGVAEIHPSNTTMQDRQEQLTQIRQYSDVLDEQIEDFSISLHSETVKYDAERVVGRLLDRATGADGGSGLGTGRLGQYIRELLHDVSDWFMNVDEEQWASRRVRHYVIVSVRPDHPRVEQSASGTAAKPSRVQSIIPGLSDDGADPTRAERRREQYRIVDEQLRTIVTGFGSIDGLSAERVNVLTHAGLLLRYWSGAPATQPGNDVLNAFARDDDSLDGFETPTERWLASSHLDTNGTALELGEQLCRTYAVAPGSWPNTPEPHFLGELYTLSEVNMDIDWNVGAEPKAAVVSDLENVMPRIGVEMDKRAEEGDYSVRTVQTDQDALKTMYDALNQTAAQPWQVSMYITVRVGPEDAWRVVQDTGQEFDALHLAKQKALNEHCQKVIDALTTNRAGLRPVVDETATLDLFQSSAPGGRDVYHYGPGPSKRTRMTGGAIASAFPFVGGHLIEADGRRWGRNKQTGLPVRASFFNRGAAPHAITIGQSRSGKTYDLETGDIEWYLESPDARTLIMCDTEGGFEAETRICDGKHIVIDGSETINPLHIEKPPQHVIDREGRSGSDHLALKVREVKEFFAAVLRSDGSDPDDYLQILDGAIWEAYDRTGITSDPATHRKESPTIRDVIDVLLDQADQPAAYTWSGQDTEVGVREEKIGRLLDDLSAFKEGNRLDYMVGATDAGLLEADTNMIYIDLSQSDSDSSIMLHLILGQLYQKVKRRGKFKFSIDEAHDLLHSKSMVEYLEDAARAWARYDACLHFITQSPREFIERASWGGDENKRETILEQCSIVQVFRTPRIKRELLGRLGLNSQQIDFIKHEAVQGKMGLGYSECLINFQDRRGWWEMWVEASPFEDLLWNWNPRIHDDLPEYLDQWWDWQDHHVVGAGPPTTAEDAEEAQQDQQPDGTGRYGRRPDEEVRVDGGGR
jgi:hypothetical protein